MSIKRDVKTALDEAIQAGKQPKAPRSGIGLVLPLNSRNRALVDKNGVTKLGTYYYRQMGIDAPMTFDFQQDAVRRGRSKFIKLLDGTQKKVSTWDNIKNEWNFTKLGQQFYAKAVDRYVVEFPVRILITRTNGSIFQREDWKASNAFNDLGIIEVPKTLSDQEQVDRVKQIERAWRRQKPKMDGHTVLDPGYETILLDTSRQIQYSKQVVNQAGTVETTMHRPW